MILSFQQMCNIGNMGVDIDSWRMLFSTLTFIRESFYAILLFRVVEGCIHDGTTRWQTPFLLLAVMAAASFSDFAMLNVKRRSYTAQIVAHAATILPAVCCVMIPHKPSLTDNSMVAVQVILVNQLPKVTRMQKLLPPTPSCREGNGIS